MPVHIHPPQETRGRGSRILFKIRFLVYKCSRGKTWHPFSSLQARGLRQASTQPGAVRGVGGFLHEAPACPRSPSAVRRALPARRCSGPPVSSRQASDPARGHCRFRLPSFLRSLFWLRCGSSILWTRKHSLRFWDRILGFKISSVMELGNQPLSWSCRRSPKIHPVQGRVGEGQVVGVRAESPSRPGLPSV